SFEHTQIDLEMSFVSREDVMKLIEEMMIKIIEDLGYHIRQKPFPVYTHAKALKEFGADKFDLRTPEEKKSGIFSFAWVIDFPLFKKIDGGKWTYSHNPFTGPRPEDEAKLEHVKDIENIISLQYDLVCNGHEIGGGGIRIHKPNLLKKVFEIIGHKPENIERDFGHMLKAFTYGAPPEGGIALGIDRIVAVLTGENSVREVQAFPMTSGGRTAVMDAPSEISKEQLDELGLSLKAKKNVS
ncbi:MAG: aspartate--tRNA ligase, partial [Candidatus Ryanbacteria bacterium]|nr:aspartate--tRNA ligase [Candidatus Ryanbacteria bacterium]